MSSFYSRRHFIKQNSLIALGMSLGGIPDLFSKPVEDSCLFFDGFTRIGPDRINHPAEKWRLSDLLGEMEHCSISGGLVAYTLSVNYDPMYANLELSDLLKPHPHLFAIWNVMPHQTGEFPAPAELGRYMQDHNVRAVSIHPKSNSWDWKADHSVELFGFLGERKILTIFSAGELGGWHEVDEFLDRYPGVPVLLIQATWAEQRFLLPLVSRYQNLHVSFGQFQINEGMEYFYKKGCIDQAVFASHAPAMSAGAHRCYIDLAGIPAEARAKAAGGNLIRLLGWPEPPATRVNKEEDALMKAVRQGGPLPVPVVDMHMHILDKGLHGVGRHYRMENGGPDGVFPLLERLGYQGGGLMSWNGIQSYVAAAGNITTGKALDAAPGGFWGLGTFDPTHYSQSELSRMIPALYADKRFIGMKPYHFFGVEYHHPSYDVWWKYGHQHKLYALVHSSRPDLLEVETLAQKYPRVRWVIAHAGGSFRMADMAVEAMNKYPNVYAEITLTSVPLGIIEYLVEGAGEERILYGSDLPMRDPRQQLGWVVFSRLTPQAKSKVLGENALRVIAPCMERLPPYNRPVFG